MPSNPEISLVMAEKKHIPILWPWYQEHIKDNFIGQVPNIKTLTDDVMYDSGNRFVAYCNKVPVGYFWIDVKVNKYDNKMEANLRFLHVDSHFRHQGIGSQLLKAAENMAKCMDASYMTLGTSYQNKIARTLYNKSGYRPTRAVYRKDFK